MKPQLIALFGESEKGNFNTAYYVENLAELEHHLGNPPPSSKGLFFAVQAILYDYKIIFFRVREEGFHAKDYREGIDLLADLHEKPKTSPTEEISAIYAPGVGDVEIIHAILPLCLLFHSLFITNEADFYDYVTAIV